MISAQFAPETIDLEGFDEQLYPFVGNPWWTMALRA
jgi:hypothetical protein